MVCQHHQQRSLGGHDRSAPVSMGTCFLEAQWIRAELSGERDDMSFGRGLWVQHAGLLQRLAGGLAAIHQYCMQSDDTNREPGLPLNLSGSQHDNGSAKDGAGGGSITSSG